MSRAGLTEDQGNRAMAPSRIYLDYNASAPLLPAARDAMLAAMEIAANPSSVHAEGRSARRIVEDARRDVAALAGGKAEHVVFTSGATEAASMLLTPDWMLGRSPFAFRRLVVCASDHPCILGGGRFGRERVTVVGVDGNGIIDLTALDRLLTSSEPGQTLVAVHAANNETGVIQPLARIASIAKSAGATLVVDAVQAAGRIRLDIEAACIDFVILSAHKIGGPKGVGAIVSRDDVMMPTPLVSGGGQERGFRAGTENVPGIAGFGAAANEARRASAAMGPVLGLRDRLEATIRNVAPDARIFGEAVERLPNTVFFAVPGMNAETLQIALDLEGFAVSAGSACSSGKIGPSHVLAAMGHGNAASAIRVSTGTATTAEEIDGFAATLGKILLRSAARRAA